MFHSFVNQAGTNTHTGITETTATPSARQAQGNRTDRRSLLAMWSVAASISSTTPASTPRTDTISASPSQTCRWVVWCPSRFSCRADSVFCNKSWQFVMIGLSLRDGAKIIGQELSAFSSALLKVICIMNYPTTPLIISPIIKTQSIPSHHATIGCQKSSKCVSIRNIFCNDVLFLRTKDPFLSLCNIHLSIFYNRNKILGHQVELIFFS